MPLCAAAAVVAVASASARAGPPLLLPDLDQRAPSMLQLSVVNGRTLLVFASNVENVGRGPLIVEGRRASRDVSTMRGDQIVNRSAGSAGRIRGIGRLRYDVEPTHSHWHLLPFEEYELRTVDGRSLGRSRKAGFCLTDGHRARGHIRGTPRRARFRRGVCRPRRPDALRLREGISVGYGDVYQPLREGQYADVSGLPPGVYVLVHHVNAGRRLRESDYGNDAASVRLRLVPPALVRVVRSCDDSARC